VIVGVAMIKTGTDKGGSSLCEDIGKQPFSSTKYNF
jgi:hypothetical protein